MRNVLFIPELSANLLSVSQLTRNGCKVEFNEKGCNIYIMLIRFLLQLPDSPITCINSTLLLATHIPFHMRVKQILLAQEIRKLKYGRYKEIRIMC